MLSVSHIHANGQTIPYPRPDRVMRTSVIAPYPIRQYSPVALARNTIVPFINDIRPMGPYLQNSTMAQAMLQGGGGLGASGNVNVYLPTSPAQQQGSAAQQAMLQARAVRRQVPFPPQRGTSKLMAAKQIMPGQGPNHYEYDVGRAKYRYNQAAATGTVWQILQARQREIAFMRRRRR